MGDEQNYRIAFSGLFFLMVVIRAYYHWRAGTHKEHSIGDKEAYAEGVRRIGWGLTLLLMLCLYMIDPRLLDWSALPLPSWLRWSGVPLGVVGLLLLVWTQHALGKNFSTTLRLRPNHTLVTHGPYRWIRHPMYTALILVCAAFFLLSANACIGVLVSLGILGVLRVRTPQEEAMMLEAYGDTYRDYMKRTTRYLPLLGRRG